MASPAQQPIAIAPDGRPIYDISQMARPMPPTPAGGHAGLLGSIGAEIESGVAGAGGAIAQALSSTLGAVGSGTAVTGLQSAATDLNAYAARKAAQSSFAQSLDQVHGVGSALGFGAHVILQGLPTLAGIAGADALTGGAAVPLDGVIGEKLLQTFGSKAIERGTAALTAAGMGADEAASTATNAVAQAIGRRVASTAAGAAATYPLAVGQLLSEQQQETGHTNLMSAAALGVPDALLNTVGPEGLLKYGLPKGLASEGASTLGRFASAIGSGVAGQGAVGAAQGFVGAVNSASVGGQGLDQQNLGYEIGAGAAGGALVGGMFGALGGVGVHTAGHMGDEQIAAAVKDQQIKQQALQQAQQQAAQAQAINDQVRQGAAQPVAYSTQPEMFEGQNLGQNPSVNLDNWFAAPPTGEVPASRAAMPMMQQPDLFDPMPPKGVQGEMFPGQDLGAAPGAQPPPQPATPSAQGEMFPGQNLGTAPQAQQAPEGQGDLFAPRPAAQAPIKQGDLLAHTPQEAASDINVGPRQLLLQMRAAASDGEKLPPATGRMAKLANQVGTALQAGDLDAAKAAVSGFDEELQSSKISSKSLDQHLAALDVAKGAINSMQARVKEIAADQHADERDEATTIAQGLQGKVSQELIRRAADAHATGKATIQHVRDVGAALAARKFPAARQLVEAIEAGHEAAPGPDETTDASQQPGVEAVAQGAPADRAAPAAEPGGPSGASDTAPEVQGPLNRADPIGTVPESQATLDAQQQELLSGRRAAMLYPKDTNGAQITPLDLPAGMKAHETPEGIFHYNPKKTGPKAIETAIAKDKLGKLLGLGSISKKDAVASAAAGERPVAVVERAPDGTELKTAVGTDKTAPKQVKELEKNAAPDSTITVEDPAKVMQERAASRNVKDAGSAWEKYLSEMAARKFPADRRLVEEIGERHEAAPEPEMPPLTPSEMHERLADHNDYGHLGLRELDDLIDKVDEGKHDEVRARLKELDQDHRDEVGRFLEINDAAREQGAISPKEHARISADLQSENPDKFNAARAQLALAQRKTGEATKANGARLRTGPGEGMTREAAQQAVDEARLGTGAPKVNVVQHAGELPEDIRDTAAEAQAKGVYHNGTVHIIAGAHQDASDVQATLFHEALGHAGLERQFGSKLDEVLSDIYRTNVEVRRAADAWMSEHPGLYKGEPDQAARATEEVLARMQESAGQPNYLRRTALARVLGVVRAFGRRLGIVKAYTDGDVQHILQRSADMARTTPRPVTAQAPRFRTAAGTMELPKFELPTKDELKSTFERSRLSAMTAATKATLNLLANRQIAERYERVLPQTRTLVDLMARASSRKQVLMDLGISPSDTLKALPKAELESVSRLLLDSRLEQVDARAPNSKFADRFSALTPAGRAAYDEALNYYSTMRTAMLQSWHQLADDIAEDNEATARSMKDMLKQVQNLPVYVPLMRRGEYLVNATHEDGRYIHEAFKSSGEALQRAKELKRQGFDTKTFEADDRGGLADPGLEEMYGRLQAAVDTKAAKFEKDGETEIANALRGTLADAREIMLQLMPESAKAKSLIAAKGIEGYMTDMSQVTALAAKRYAQTIANIEHGHASRKALDEMRVAAKSNSGDSFTLSQVYKQMKQNYLNSLRIDDTPIQNFLNQVGYVYQLGGSPAFSFMHFMQTPLVTLPMLSSKFDKVPGIGPRSSGALTKAFAEVGKLYKFGHDDDISRYGKNEGEKLMLRHLDMQGHFGNTDAQSRLNAVINDGTLSKTGRRLMALASAAPHHTERFNRIVTALAAYRLNEELHTRPENLDEYQRFRDTFRHDPNALAMTPQQHSSMRIAEDLVLNSHIDYNAVNAPGLFSSSKVPLRKLAFQFKKYEQGMLYNLIGSAKDALNSKMSGTERKMAARMFTGLLITHGLAAGAMGLPFYGLATGLVDLYHQFFTDHDYTWDADTEFRNWLAKELGPEMGAAVARGMLYLPAIRKVLPADITDRIGMGDLFSMGNFSKEISSDQLVQAIGNQVTGSTGALLGQFINAYGSERAGNSWRAVEDLLPKALRDVAKADRFYIYGVNSQSGQPILSQVSGTDEFMQAIGFRPQDVQQAESAREAVYTATNEIQSRHKEITQQFTRALAEGEPISPIMGMIEKFNEARMQQHQYGYMITGKVLQQAAQNYLRNKALLANGVSLRGKDYEAFRRLVLFAHDSEGQTQ